MAGGRTVWLAKDAAWWRREWIVELGEEFGSAGPAVIDWLTCEAKAQNDGGFLKTGRKSVARGCFVELVTVGHVLSRSVTLGLLEEFEETEGRFTCRISGWSSDQGKAMAATRKAKQRADTPVEPDDPAPLSRFVPSSHGESQNVTLTGQDRTERAKALSSGAERARKENEKATDDDRASCRLFGELVRDRNSKAKIPKANTGEWAAWLREMRLLRSDGNAPVEINAAIRWVFADPCQDALFWGTTIQAPSGLRSNFSKIWAKMQAAPLRAVPTLQDSASLVAKYGQTA